MTEMVFDYLKNYDTGKIPVSHKSSIYKLSCKEYSMVYIGIVEQKLKTDRNNMQEERDRTTVGRNYFLTWSYNECN